MANTTFEGTVYKETTRQQWLEAAEAWHRWDPTFEAWLGPASSSTSSRGRSIPIGIIRRRAELPPPAPGLPGPFSATGIGPLLEEAGFHDVRVERVAAPLRVSSAAECTRLSGSRSGRSTKCWPAWARPSRRTRGPRSRRRCRSSRAPTASSGPASSSSQQQPRRGRSPPVTRPGRDSGRLQGSSQTTASRGAS